MIVILFLTPNYCLAFLLFLLLLSCVIVTAFFSNQSANYLPSNISHNTPVSFSYLQIIVVIFYNNTICHLICIYCQDKNKILFLEWTLLAAITIFSTFTTPTKMLLSQFWEPTPWAL